MIRNIIRYFSGYHRILISCACYERAVITLFKNNIKTLNQGKTRNQAFFDVRKNDAALVLSCLLEDNIEVIDNADRGFVSLLYRYRHRPGIFIGLLLLIMSLWVSEKFIWHIDVTGNEKISDEKTIELLESHGIHIGSYIPSLDLHDIYNKILIDSEYFSWISVNIRGTIAYVEVREVEPPMKMTPVKGKCANVIAEFDGEITAIRNVRGNSVVIPGQAVKEGEILLSGIYEDKMGRTNAVYAQGEVYATIRRDFCVKIPLNYEEKVYTGSYSRDLSLKIFSNKINILNNSRNIDTKYDIIENKGQPCLFDRVYLPLYYEQTIYSEYITVPASRSPEQAQVIALETMNREIIEFLGDGDIITKITQGSVENTEYVLKATVVMNKNIAKTQEFVYNEG